MGSLVETLKDFFGADGARVWSGIRFLNADIDGCHVAKKIAQYRNRNYFQPVG